MGGHKPRAGCLVLTYLKNKLYVILVETQDCKDASGRIGPPKGVIRDDETPWECARRETFEETGIAVNDHLSEVRINHITIFISFVPYRVVRNSQGFDRHEIRRLLFIPADVVSGHNKSSKLLKTMIQRDIINVGIKLVRDLFSACNMPLRLESTTNKLVFE
jgi:8-oxo-dGTP pyrophosphatase MutT (NUDIX family)